MINNYNSLLSEISDELNRKDLESKAPVWVRLAETRLRRDLDVGRCREPNYEFREPFDNLGLDNQVNYVLTNHPDLYFYGSLLHSAPYLDDDQRLGTWASFYQNAVESINLRAREHPANTDCNFLQLSSHIECRPEPECETNCEDE